MRKTVYIAIGIAFIVFSNFQLRERENLNRLFIAHSYKSLPDLALPVFMDDQSSDWADSVIKTMTTDERIAQLFMVAAYSNKDTAHEKEIINLVQQQKIGGLIFFQGSPSKQAILTNHYQGLAKVPLLTSIDAEWGLAMRLDSTHKFPKQMTLGAINNNDLIYKMAEIIAKQCKRIGIHVNLAPVADVNNNPNNPVINYRSFGEDKNNVTEKCLAYVKGMQDHGIMANAKHFPGHGDTDADSHKTLPTIHHSMQRLDSLELYPFKQLINNGVGSIMVAHLYIPQLDSAPNRAATLSKTIVSGLLKNRLQFDGLIFTDALNMRGVSAFYAPGKVDVQAVLAGNDVLLFSEDVPKAIEAIKKAIAERKISQKEIDKRCHKILMAKKWSGLDKIKPIKVKGLGADLNGKKAKLLNLKLYEEALTLVKNKDNFIPIKRLDTLRIATISIGEKATNTFSERVDMYCRTDFYSFSRKMDSAAMDAALAELKMYNCVLISVFGMNQRPHKNFNFTPSTDAFIDALKKSDKRVVVNLLGNPYALTNSKTIDAADVVLIGYEEEEATKNLSAQLLFGGISAKGHLPVSINKKYPVRHGIQTNEIIRFKYTVPEELGIEKKELNGIDSIVQEGIKGGVFPGCQILVAKEGKVFYHETFGKHTYKKSSKKVEKSDIYDLASITKIASTTAALMKLQNDSLIHVDSTLGKYLNKWMRIDTTDYKELKLKEMLTHQAGLTPWIPFYIRTLHKGQPKIQIYSTKQSDYFDTRVANDLYTYKGYRDSIFKRILSTKVSDRKKYKYSDVGYYFIHEIIQRTTKMSQDQFLEQAYYKPLGLDNIGYKPREHWDSSRIPPTEEDSSFRHQMIQGDVHDQGAALMGGVCGHAGLFANANDLAVIMQTFMQYGEYGGARFYSKEIGKLFTSSPYYSSNKNRRGIGFDKPVRSGTSGPTCSGCASNKSFGHSGFTGTLTWADPNNGLVYVFLSNRTYPDAENRKIISTSTRTRIMQVIYDAIKKAKKSAALPKSGSS